MTGGRKRTLDSRSSSGPAANPRPCEVMLWRVPMSTRSACLALLIMITEREAPCWNRFRFNSCCTRSCSWRLNTCSSSSMEPSMWRGGPDALEPPSSGSSVASSPSSTVDSMLSRMAPGG